MASEKLEDTIESFPADLFDGMSADYFRSIVRISRGLYKPGLNLILSSSTSPDSLTITSRLQENRRYLDADPETIGSRFGVAPQQWTIVGTVGHYSDGPTRIDLAKMAETVTTNSSEGHFDRNGFMRLINNVIQNIGRAGMIDLPQHPAFSAIPIAVYRSTIRGISPIERLGLIEQPA